MAEAVRQAMRLQGLIGAEERVFTRLLGEKEDRSFGKNFGAILCRENEALADRPAGEQSEERRWV